MARAAVKARFSPCSCDERSVLEVRENWAVLHENFKKLSCQMRLLFSRSFTTYGSMQRFSRQGQEAAEEDESKHSVDVRTSCNTETTRWRQEPIPRTAQWYKVIIAAAERNTQGKTLQNYCETLYSQRQPRMAPLDPHARRKHATVIPSTSHREQSTIAGG